MIIYDADILSVFAKIDRLDLLQRLSGPILITPQIKEEISIPAQYGYQFPNRILKVASTLPLTSDEMTTYEALRENLGRGGSEGISLAKHRNYIFATNDKVAFKFAVKEKVAAINLQVILRALFLSNSLTRNEILSLVEEMSIKDGLIIPQNVLDDILADAE